MSNILTTTKKGVPLRPKGLAKLVTQRPMRTAEEAVMAVEENIVSGKGINRVALTWHDGVPTSALSVSSSLSRLSTRDVFRTRSCVCPDEE